MHQQQIGPARFVLIAVILASGGLAASLFAPLTPEGTALANCSTSQSPANPDAQEQSMLSLINSYRARNGAPPLSVSLALTSSALWKSEDMAANHYFAHDDLIRSWSQRLSDCGYGAATTGENIAEGYADAQDTLTQWESSPPHNANLLNPNFHAIGIGRASDASGQWYWTTDFGGVADAGTASLSTASTPLTPPTPPTPPALPLSPQTTASTIAPPSLLPAPTPASPQVGASSIQAGMTASVDTPNDCLRAHSAPVLASPVEECLPNGTSVVVVGGPVPGDGYTWWDLFNYGWVAGAYLDATSSG